MDGYYLADTFFTDLNFLDSFETKLNENSAYFEAILEIDGYERTGFDSELIHFRKIEKE